MSIVYDMKNVSSVSMYVKNKGSKEFTLMASYEKEKDSMIRIIKEGNKKVVDCPNCDAVLEYQHEDKHKTQTGINEWADYIDCPCCKKKIYL